jgi:hypothetical protein
VATNYSILTGSFALCSAILVGTGYGWFAVIPGGIGLLPAIALLRLLRRMDRYEKMF